MVDALTQHSDEGRCRLRKASGRCQAIFDPRMSEWGNPTDLICNLDFNHDAHPGK